jgi:hypothetical protein
MKFVLYMIICSALYGECLPAHRMVTTYNTHYDCMMAGYEAAIKKQKEIGKQESNKYQTLIKFMCSYEKVEQPEVELES